MPPTRQVSNTAADALRESRFRHFDCRACTLHILCVRRSFFACVLLVCCAVYCAMDGCFSAWMHLQHPCALSCELCGGGSAAVPDGGGMGTGARTMRNRREGHLRQCGDVQTPCERVAPPLQADEVRCLSSPALFLCMAPLPRVDEGAARCPSRNFCARAPLLPRSCGGQKATSCRPSADGSGARKQPSSTNFSNRCQTTYKHAARCLMHVQHTHNDFFCLPVLVGRPRWRSTLATTCIPKQRT